MNDFLIESFLPAATVTSFIQSLFANLQANVAQTRCVLISFSTVNGRSHRQSFPHISCSHQLVFDLYLVVFVRLKQVVHRDLNEQSLFLVFIGLKWGRSQ
jgi:hypothetical protein